MPESRGPELIEKRDSTKNALRAQLLPEQRRKEFCLFTSLSSF